MDGSGTDGTKTAGTGAAHVLSGVRNAGRTTKGTGLSSIICARGLCQEVAFVSVHASDLLIVDARQIIATITNGRYSTAVAVVSSALADCQGWG